MCFHQTPNALPPQTQHNFWNGLEALAPSSKLMQKCCLYSHKRPLYVVEGCFLLSTLYQWRTSGNHRGHLHYNSWWMSGATGIPFEHSCPQRLGNEGYWPQNHYLLCLGRQSILQTSLAFFVFHLTNQGLTVIAFFFTRMLWSIRDWRTSSLLSACKSTLFNCFVTVIELFVTSMVQGTLLDYQNRSAFFYVLTKLLLFTVNQQFNRPPNCKI